MLPLYKKNQKSFWQKGGDETFLVFSPCKTEAHLYLRLRGTRVNEISWSEIPKGMLPIVVAVNSLRIPQAMIVCSEADLQQAISSVENIEYTYRFYLFSIPETLLISKNDEEIEAALKTGGLL